MTFAGTITALVTPFYQGEVDKTSLKQLIRQQLDWGIQGFVVNGTTAESPCLNHDELQDLFALVRSEVAGQVPLILGTGTNSTANSITLTQEAKAWGADAALVVTPYYNKPPQRGLIQHFTAIADTADLPIILYNVPTRTITALDLSTLQTLSHHRNIIGVKEASGDLDFGVQVMKNCEGDFFVTSGDDGTCVQLALHGSYGVISVMSHVLGQVLVPMMERARNRDAKAVSELDQYKPLIAALYCETNPIPVKMALYLLGVIRSPEMRLPLVALEEARTQQLQQVLKDLL